MGLPAKLLIDHLEFHAFHGCYPHEATFGQQFAVDLELGLDIEACAKTDQLSQGLDYGLLIETVRKLFVEIRYNLIESAAFGVARGLLETYPQLCSARIRVKKITPPVPEKLRYVAVELSLDRADLGAF